MPVYQEYSVPTHRHLGFVFCRAVFSNSGGYRTTLRGMNGRLITNTRSGYQQSIVLPVILNLVLQGDEVTISVLVLIDNNIL